MVLQGFQPIRRFRQSRDHTGAGVEGKGADLTKTEYSRCLFRKALFQVSREPVQPFRLHDSEESQCHVDVFGRQPADFMEMLQSIQSVGDLE